MALDSFIVLEASGESIANESREAFIRETLREQLHNPANADRHPRRRTTRRLRHFSIPTQVKFDHDAANQRTIMEVVSADRPGLLSCIGWALVDCGVSLQNAKIATFGERAEDIFYVTDQARRPLAPDLCERLRHEVMSVLSAQPG